MDYLIISDIVRVGNDSYPIVFMAARSGEGFKRITDIDLFFKNGEVSDTEEAYTKNMKAVVIKRSASIKIDVNMPG